MLPALAEDAPARDAYKKVGARLLPILFICYIVAYLDRVNVGFAKLQMASALSLSDAAYGFGAGIFFIGYFLFEVPSNLILQRVGARAWIARIMITWGIVSGAFAYVESIPWGPLPALFGLPRVEFSFYALRLLLGIAEAGFFPGIILYLTYWYPAARRARAVAVFMTAIAAANVVGAPLSGGIMQFAEGWAGWPGWRWLFVLEALPSVVLGVVVLVLLPDGPESATWLSNNERRAIVHAVETDARAREGNAPREGALAAFANPRVWAFSLVYLSAAFAMYGINFWIPTIIQELGVARTDYLMVGLISMIPWGIAGISMVVVGSHSDRTGERRWHTSGSLAVTALGLLMLASVGTAPIPSVIALTVIASGVLSFISTFWAVPTAMLRGSAAAAGIAWINSVGNLGGHFGPDLIGRVRTATNSSANAFLALAAIAMVGTLLMMLVTRNDLQVAARGAEI